MPIIGFRYHFEYCCSTKTLDEMSHILTTTLVPTVEVKGQLKVCQSVRFTLVGQWLEFVEFRHCVTHKQGILTNTKGLEPVVEDWHAKMTLLKVTFDIAYVKDNKRDAVRSRSNYCLLFGGVPAINILWHF